MDTRQTNTAPGSHSQVHLVTHTIPSTWRPAAADGPMHLVTRTRNNVQVSKVGNKYGAMCGTPGRLTPSGPPADACASRTPPRADVDASIGQVSNHDDGEAESDKKPMMAV